MKLKIMKQDEGKLCFVSWNTRGIKNTKKHPNKLSKILDIVNSLNADVVFLQETHIGPNCWQKILRQETVTNYEGWKFFYTVHLSNSKGVAILIKENIPFEYIDHDEDCSGGYFVLNCRLHGTLYTLVNVYNHKHDRIVLGRLTEYLRMRDNGVLVVGGDFNTYLNKDIDCDPPRQNTSPLKAVLDRFTSSLEIEDTWSYRHGNNLDNWRFTCKQRQSYSRIDMFFMRKDTMNNELSIRVHTETISDHYPLVLQLQMQTKQPKTSKMPQSKQDNPNSNRTTQNNPDNTTEKISVAEILCALKSLTSKTHGCQTSSKTVFTLNSTEYIRLKNTYNDILKTNTLPANFTKVEKNIFSSVITKRLELYGISLKQTLNVLPTKTKYNRSYLEKMAEDLDRKYKDKGLKLYAFAPKINVKILNCFKD